MHSISIYLNARFLGKYLPILIDFFFKPIDRKHFTLPYAISMAPQHVFDKNAIFIYLKKNHFKSYGNFEFFKLKAVK